MKMSLYINITQMWGSEAYIMKGGNTFLSTKTFTQYASGPINLKFENISQNEYIYIIAKGRQGNAGFQFNVSGFGDVILPVNNSANATAPPTYLGSSDSTNWPLIIGCVVGGVAVIGIGAFLTYYFVKKSKLKAQKAALIDQGKVKLIKPKAAQKKTLIKEESVQEYDSESEEEEDKEEVKKPPPPKRQALAHMPVHPDP
jgi:hypothetical protein